MILTLLIISNKYAFCQHSVSVTADKTALCPDEKVKYTVAGSGSNFVRIKSVSHGTKSSSTGTLTIDYKDLTSNGIIVEYVYKVLLTPSNTWKENDKTETLTNPCSKTTINTMPVLTFQEMNTQPITPITVQCKNETFAIINNFSSTYWDLNETITLKGPGINTNGVTFTSYYGNVSLDKGGSQTYTAKGKQKGCVVESMGTIIITDVADGIGLTANGNLCQFTPSQLIANGPTGTSYIWSSSNPDIVFDNTTGVFTNITSPQSGTQQIDLSVSRTQSQKTCTTTKNFNVSINPSIEPVFSLFVNNLNQVEITNNSNYTVANPVFEWTFGNDANPSTYVGENPPNIAYNMFGQKTITVKAYYQAGLCEKTFSENVTIDVRPIANFSFPTGYICQGATFTLTNATTTIPSGFPNNADLRYDWDFGDGTTLLNQSYGNVSHSYSTSGTKAITLTVRNIVSNISSSKTISQFIRDLPNTPSIQIDWPTNNPKLCSGKEINFQDFGQTTDHIHRWNWGSGTSGWDVVLSNVNTANYTYSSHGTYTVTKETENIYGCISSNTASITVQPTPQISFDAFDDEKCENEEIDLVATNTNSASTVSNVNWQLKKGTASTSQWGTTNANGDYIATVSNSYRTGSHYLDPGIWDLTLTLTSNQGCIASETATFEFFETPKPNFSFTEVCEKNDNPTEFTNTTSGPQSAYTWDFGNNTSSTNQNPTPLSYGSAGNYNVELTVTENTNNCSESITKTVIVKNSPTADFNWSNIACENQEITFNDNSTITGSSLASWEWDFDDGSNLISTTTNMQPHTYLSDGNYDIDMKVTAANGCWDSKVKTLIIHPKPAPPSISALSNSNGNTHPVCFGEQYLLQANPSSGYTYTWLTNGLINTSDVINGSVLTSNTGTSLLPSNSVYKVKITDNNGCYAVSSDWAAKIIKPNASIAFADATLTHLCQGQTAELTGADPSQSYNWFRAPYNEATQTFSNQFDQIIGNTSITQLITNSVVGRYKFIADKTLLGLTCSKESETIDIINALPLEINQTGTHPFDANQPLVLEPVLHTYPSYTSYKWYHNSLHIANGNSFTPILPGQYFLLANGDCGLEKSSTFTLYHDCGNPYNQYYMPAQNFNTPTTLDPVTIQGTSPFLRVSNDWTVNSTLDIRGLVLVADNCFKIKVDSGAELNLDGVTIVGCDDWRGIENQGELNIAHSNIAGAKYGVYSTGNSTAISNSVFTNNEVHVALVNPTGFQNILNNKFGDVHMGVSCDDEYNLFNSNEKYHIYASQSTNLSVQGNTFLQKEPSQGIDIIGVKLLSSPYAMIAQNKFSGYHNRAFSAGICNNLSFNNNTVEKGIALNDPDLKVVLNNQNQPPATGEYVGAYIRASQGANIESNIFNNLERGLEFYKGSAVLSSVSTIQNNKFSNNLFALLSATEENPNVYPNANSSSGFVNIQVNCNNFTGNNYGWLGTGSYPNQGSLSLEAGNAFTNQTEWNLLVLDNAKDYFNAAMQDQNSGNLNKSAIDLDGATIDASNFTNFNIDFSISGNYNPCQNMKMKTNWLEAEDMVENEDQPEMDLLTTQIPVVYPNPTKGGFYIDIKEDAIYAITLMDMHGKHIDLPFSTVEKDAFIALDGLRTGIYILRLNANQTQHTYKIVKID